MNDDNYIIYVGDYKSKTKSHEKGDPHYKNVTVRHLRHYKLFDDELLDTSPQWIVRGENEEGYPMLEIDIQEEKEGKEEKEDDSEEVIEMKGDFAICPYWEWNDISEDKMPFSVVKILSKIDERHYIVRRYGNNNNDAVGVQKPGWIHRGTRKVQYVEKISRDKKLWVEYTNAINEENFKTKHTIWDHSIYGQMRFELTDRKTVPIEVLKVLEKEKYIRNYEPSPFSLRDD